MPPRPAPPKAALAAFDQPMQVQMGVRDADDFLVDSFTWSYGGSRRLATVVRNNVPDPTGQWGGYMRRFEFVGATGPRSCVGATDSHPGFGFAVNHFGKTSVSSRSFAGEAPVMVMQGRHHALLQQRWTYPIDGYPVTVTVQWLFATGRPNPLWAVTFDSSAAPANAIRADTRAPYGDINWDGGAQADVDGVAWGDHKKFISLDSPLTLASGWDYTTANIVPYTLAFSRSADAEMGLVQTQSQTQHDAGGYWGTNQWGQRNAAGPMPEAYNWPFQINQYELAYTSASKRMAWGSNYGAVGQTAYPSLGETELLSGYPYQSYSTYIVIGNHSRAPVDAQVHEVEALLQMRLTAGDHAEVARCGPGGVGRTDEVAYAVPGLNPVYNALEATYTGRDGAPMQLSVASDAGLKLSTSSTLVRIHNWPTAKVAITRDGARVREGFGYFASYDAAAHVLWLSIDGLDAAASTALTLAPQVAAH